MGRLAEGVSYIFEGPGDGHVVRISTAEVARNQFGAADPSDHTAREALDAAFDFDEMFGTHWYIEIYDAEGTLTYSAGGRTFDQVKAAVKSKADGEVARFMAPSSATMEQIRELEALGVGHA